MYAVKFRIIDIDRFYPAMQYVCAKTASEAIERMKMFHMMDGIVATKYKARKL